jgi:hypothetical protein
MNEDEPRAQIDQYSVHLVFITAAKKILAWALTIQNENIQQDPILISVKGSFKVLLG